MKKLNSFKKLLLMHAMVLSMASSHLSAVSEEVVRAYWQENSCPNETLNSQGLNNLIAFNDDQWALFTTTAQSLMTDDMDGWMDGWERPGLASSGLEREE